MDTLDKLTDLKSMWKARALEAEKKSADKDKTIKGLQEEIQRLQRKGPIREVEDVS